MSGFFSPNFAIGSSWRSALTILAAQFRKTKFAIDTTFEFKDFDPQPNWNGMTVSAVTYHRCRYAVLGKMLFLSVTIRANLAAPLTNIWYITLPETLQGYTADKSGVSGIYQQGEVTFLVPGGYEVGFWTVSASAGNTGFMGISRNGLVAYPAGAMFASLNAFVEIE